MIENPIGNSRNHSEECRNRIENLLQDDSQGQAKLQHAKDRIDEYVAMAHEAPHDGKQ